jgi:EAL domain-containing protein (putative c-di-GMP-specific phosphodiesterase class I)
MQNPITAGQFYLVGDSFQVKQWKVLVNKDRFLIGRQDGCDLRLEVMGISRIHAEIYKAPDGWRIKDCRSTNGTFVNHQRVEHDQLLNDGDRLVLAELRFKILSEPAHDDCTIITNPHAPSFERMMRDKAVTPHLQPIIDLRTGNTVGFEVLGRVHYMDLPESPGPLFGIAEKLGMHVTLSKLFRETAFSQLAEYCPDQLIFFNMLPCEFELSSIGQQMALIHEKYPNLNLVMELHESVVTNPKTIREVLLMLKRHNMLLAYDDFGAGQARLLELMEAPPSVIKFDIQLISKIDQRPQASQAMLATLIHMAADLGTKTLAEGVETQAEAEVCKQLGFDLAQGFYFGRPAPIDRLLKPIPMPSAANPFSA